MRSLAAIFLALVLLWVWHETYARTCLGLIPALWLILLLTQSLRLPFLRRRICLSQCWFQDNRLPARILRGRWLATLRAFWIALFSGGFLLLQLPLWNQTLWLVLAGDSFLILLWVLLFQSLSKHWFQPESQACLVQSWSTWTNTLLMAGGSLVLQLYSPVPPYLRESLHKTLEIAGQLVASNCAMLDRLIRLYQQKEALAWWLMVQGSPQLPIPWLRWTAWLLFLLSGTLAFWAYSRFIVQMIFLAQSSDHDAA